MMMRRESANAYEVWADDRRRQFEAAAQAMKRKGINKYDLR